MATPPTEFYTRVARGPAMTPITFENIDCSQVLIWPYPGNTGLVEILRSGAVPISLMANDTALTFDIDNASKITIRPQVNNEGVCYTVLGPTM